MAQPFEIVGEISDVETFATGRGIRERARLRRIYGLGRWRKRKGVAKIRLPNGSIRLAELHWYEASGIGRREFKIKQFCNVRAMAKNAPKQLVVCINNEGYSVSLERRKIYVALRDAQADEQGLVRIIDESGEDYLYPKQLFRLIALPQAVKKAVLNAT